MAHYTTERTRTLQRLQEMQAERSSWITHWRELNDAYLPRHARFFRSDRNKGDKRHNRILDNTGLKSLRVLGAGMMSGASSPARPWFRLATPDKELMAYGPVKTWLARTQALMLAIFAKSNVYLMLHAQYEGLGAFGTQAAIAMDDFETVLHYGESPIGEFLLDVDLKGRVNTVYREFEKTVGQLVREFGRENCSTTVRNLYDRGNMGAWVPVLHAIGPREDRDPRKRDARNKPWHSCYYEIGREDAGQSYLRESGYDDFPALAPRWHKGSGDIYGQSPGMDALGDHTQLQHQQLRKGQAIDFKTKPPVQAPTALRGKDTQMLPGGVWYNDANNVGQTVKPLFEVNLDLNHLLMDIQDVRERIRSAFHADLFLMLANADRTNMTATEVAERHEEKLLMLGPVLERLHTELLSPLIDQTFAAMLKNNLVPPPPEEMQGENLQVEFVSMLAQAQRAIGVNSVDRFVSNLGVIGQFKPGVLDKFDEDAWADKYADMLGVDPELVVSSEEVALVRKQRAEAQAAAVQAEQNNLRADTAAKLGTVKTGEQNAATDLLNQFSGYNSPSGVEV